MRRPTSKLVDKETTRKYFSYIASDMGRNDAANVDKFSTIEEFLLPSDTSPKVLECGGGGGFYTRRLLESGFYVTCVDLSEEALIVNRAGAAELGRLDQLETVPADFVDFCAATEQSFDQVLFIKVLHHFDSMASIVRAIECAVQRCRPRGRVLIFEPNGANPLWKPFLSLQRGMDGKNKWFYEKNMRLTTASRLGRVAADLQKAAEGVTYEITHRFVIPATILKARRERSVLRRVNRLLEGTRLGTVLSFNFALVIDVSASSEPAGGNDPHF